MEWVLWIAVAVVLLQLLWTSGKESGRRKKKPTQKPDVKTPSVSQQPVKSTKNSEDYQLLQWWYNDTASTCEELSERLVETKSEYDLKDEVQFFVEQIDKIKQRYVEWEKHLTRLREAVERKTVVLGATEVKLVVTRPDKSSAILPISALADSAALYESIGRVRGGLVWFIIPDVAIPPNFEQYVEYSYGPGGDFTLRTTKFWTSLVSWNCWHSKVPVFDTKLQERKTIYAEGIAAIVDFETQTPIELRDFDWYKERHDIAVTHFGHLLGQWAVSCAGGDCWPIIHKPRIIAPSTTPSLLNSDALQFHCYTPHSEDPKLFVPVETVLTGIYPISELMELETLLVDYENSIGKMVEQYYVYGDKSSIINAYEYHDYFVNIMVKLRKLGIIT